MKELLSSFLHPGRKNREVPGASPGDPLHHPHAHHPNHPHHPPPPPDSHPNSPELGSLLSMVREGLAGPDEIRVKLMEWNSPLIVRFDELYSQEIDDPSFLVTSLLLEEKLQHINAQQEVRELGFHGKAAAVVPLPHHLDHVLFSIRDKEMILDSDELHHERTHRFRHLDAFQPNRIRDHWKSVEALLVEAEWQEQGGGLKVRDNVLRVLQIMQKPMLRLYIHRVPRVPPHSRFVELDPGYGVRFIS